MSPDRKPIHTYYVVDYKNKTIKRTHKTCPRCKGSLLARHKNRISCGHCGYAEFSG